MEVFSDSFFRKQNSKQKHFLEQRLRVEDRGCLQNECHPPTGGTVPYPKGHGHDGHCQWLELMLGKQSVCFETTKSQEDKLKGEEPTWCASVVQSILLWYRQDPEPWDLPWGSLFVEVAGQVSMLYWISRHLFDILAISQHYKYIFF